MSQVQHIDRAYCDQVLAIFNEIIANETALYEYQPRTLTIVNQWFDDKKQNDWPVIGIVENGELMGFGSYGSFRAKPAYKYTVEHSVYVHVDARGKGIGKQLLTALVKLAKQNGIHNMIGGVDAENVGSAALHQSLGFVECSRIKHAGYKFDRWLDLVFYQLLLDETRECSQPPHPPTKPYSASTD
ncbi:MAG: N-acetyltransferase family protein [Algicola sp.]|nr:N-acetyltransferase family protein [Algicola sp.]